MKGSSGYSKIEQVGMQKPRSVDLWDFDAPLHAPKLASRYGSGNQENMVVHKSSFPEKAKEDEVGEEFGVILRRSRSAPVVSSGGERPTEKQVFLPESPEKRAFYTRRSSSVSKGYCRIHHQSDFIADDDGKQSATVARKTKKTRINILKACRNLFGF
uniref:Uncharacterized protein n=1 Tax=Rhizophora mucronata TaxID=61149 RepID=A0A2P2QVQ6_RHIMU